MEKLKEALDWIKANKGLIDYVEFPEEYQELFEKLLNREISIKEDQK